MERNSDLLHSIPHLFKKFQIKKKNYKKKSGGTKKSENHSFELLKKLEEKSGGPKKSVKTQNFLKKNRKKSGGTKKI